MSQFHSQEASALFKSQSRMHAIASVPLEAIRPNSAQPRRQISEASVHQLAESIRRHGQLSPLLVRLGDDGRYELIAGQRRLLALRLLGKRCAEVIVLSAGDCDSALIALVENMQREELHFLDEAEACRDILSKHPITQERLAASLSVSPSALANRLRLLKLGPEALKAVRRYGLTERHARALLRLPDETAQLELARQIGEERLSVKQTEARVEQRLKLRPRRQISPVVRDHRIIINAVMDTVRELKRIGIHLKSRVDEQEDHIDVVVTIPLGVPPGKAAPEPPA